MRLYEDELDGLTRVTLRRNRALISATLRDRGVLLGTRDHITGEDETIRVDRVVLATGYQDLGRRDREQRVPPLLAELLPREAESELTVGLDYRVLSAAGTPPIYVNGLCESTHGFGDAGSFSLLALRTQTIVESLRSAIGDALQPHARGAGVVPDLDRIRAAKRCTCPAGPFLSGALQ